MSAPPPEVAAWIAALPDDRQPAVQAVRDAIAGALPNGYVEGLQYGMIGFAVPHSRYPHGYHCDPGKPVPFASIGNQKGHVGLYLFCVYVDADITGRFAAAWRATGQPLDMGKGCVRVKPRHLADLPVGVIADTVRAMPVDDFLARYEAGLPAAIRKKRGLP